MNNNDLVDRLTKMRKEKTKSEDSYTEKTQRFLVFKIAEKKYALYTQQVREIVINSEIFYVPFVPPYIRGFINRLGEPYTVFDLMVLFENQQQEASKFLIMNIEDDQIAFLAKDVMEIVKVPESNIHLTSAKELNNTYFSGTIEVDKQEIFLINLKVIYERLQNDI